jgi:hypothetical protein
MAKKITRNSVVQLPQPAVNWLWNQIVEKFIAKPGSNVPVTLINEPEKFWKNRNVRQRFYTDFCKITRYQNSGMRLVSRSKGLETGDIPIEYLYEHFISCDEKLFQEDYLNKIIFYLTEDKKTAEYNLIFEKNGININIDEPNREGIPPGLRHLEGYWLGLNRNLEEGAFAKCLYRFLQVDNVMQVQREAYNAEIGYNGYVHVQGDSNFLIELDGKTRGKKKFIVADSGKLRPESIRCLSSGFNISSGGPILIKELLIKLPLNAGVSIATGSLIEDSKMKAYLEEFYEEETLELVFDEIVDFLGYTETPYFSLNDLTNIKKNQLVKINQAESEHEPVAKRVSAYAHFSRFEDTSYSRNIIKYFRDISKESESAIEETIPVFDEYLYVKNTQYEFENFYKHRVHAEAEAQNGIIDIQSLFPILENDSDNDLNMPSLKSSNRIMDAYSDSFMSSATYINDFSKTLRLSIQYDVETLQSEMVIDFCSTPSILNAGIFLDEIIFLFNDADGESSKLIKLKMQNHEKRGKCLANIDRGNLKIELDEKDAIDALNEGIYSIKIDFITKKDEAIYFQFKFK